MTSVTRGEGLLTAYRLHNGVCTGAVRSSDEVGSLGVVDEKCRHEE